jgi:hypothetical protein
MAATAWSRAANLGVYNLIVTGTAANLMAANGGGNSVIVNCFIKNTSTTAGRFALSMFGDDKAIAVEAVSLRGNAINLTGAQGLILNSYVHSSNNGIVAANTSSNYFIGNLIEDIADSGLHISTAGAISNWVLGNTVVGAATPRGTGVLMVTATTDPLVLNNIIWGFTTGIAHANTQYSTFSDFNNFFNNTTNRTNIATGANDKALDPQFANVAEVTGTSATSATSVLTAGSAVDLSAVVPGRDYLYISSATGAATGHYEITAVDNSADTVTLSPAPGTGSAITWSIITGRNYAIGTNLKGLGFPGAFPGGYTTAYTDIGGVQRQEAGAAGGGTRIY